ncbi:hypothetical protein WCE00_12620 [Acinetobacter haemolyticus]|uniref:hypothetical protein n=1 Tax=Acinetobacter haemolyticus TaxID=29430 RepID=UPI0034D7A06C
MMFTSKHKNQMNNVAIFELPPKSDAELRKTLELDLIRVIHKYQELYGLNIEDILFYCDKTIDVRVDLKDETTNTQAETTGTENTKAE